MPQENILKSLYFITSLLAMRQVAYCYEHGAGVPKNLAQAFCFYKKAVDAGNIPGD